MVKAAGTKYTILACAVSASYWAVVNFGSALAGDQYRIIFSLLFLISIIIGVEVRLVIAGLLGLLGGTTSGLLITQGLESSSQYYSEATLCWTLGLLLVIKYGKFKTNELCKWVLIYMVPLITTASFIFADHQVVILSEFKKYILFSSFLLFGLGLSHLNLRSLIVPCLASIFLASIIGVATFLIVGKSYNYGGVGFAVLPITLILIPLLDLFFRNSLTGWAVLLVTSFLILGLLQPSSKILILIALSGFKWFKRRFLFVAPVLVFGAFYGWAIFEGADDILRHKVFSIGLLIQFFFGGIDGVLVEQFFFSSAGNIIAEFITVSVMWLENWLLPLGVGVGMVDLFGWLSLANEFTYSAYAAPENLYPLHLGLFYLIMWFGPFIYFFGPQNKFFFTIVVFVLIGMSAPAAIFLSVFLSLALRR